jgi:hypothetical protein
MAQPFFYTNGLRNPPRRPAPLNQSGSGMFGAGNRLLPAETADAVKLVRLRRGTGGGGRAILNPRININAEAFNSSNTHQDPDRAAANQSTNASLKFKPIKMKSEKPKRGTRQTRKKV